MHSLAAPPVLHLVATDPALLEALARLAGSLGFGFRHWSGPDACLAGLDIEDTGVVLVECGPAGDGLGLLTRLAAHGVDLPVIVLAAQASVDHCRRAFKAGACDFLTLPLEEAPLRDAVCKAVGSHVLQHQRQRQARHARSLYTRLSEREREVLGMVVAGLTNKEIARALAVSPRTIEVHRARLASKLETDSLAQLVRQYADLADEADTRPALVCGQAWGDPLVWRGGQPQVSG
jgi:two-component system response regulator FixJ